MKKTLKRSLSLLLAITIIFSSAYVGLSEVDFNYVNQFIKKLTLDFSVKSYAVSESDLTFKLNDDGVSYSVTDCDTYANGEIVIPETYNNLPVTSISSYAFNYCQLLTSVIIPDSVTSIGNGAFNRCTKLESVTIPDELISIGEMAFLCTNLTSILIPDTVTTIGNNAFYDCANLVSINVGENNTRYSSVDGVLFNKDKTKLIHYSANKADTEYTIPDTTTSIKEYAFYNCKNISSVAIPDSVTWIGEDNFLNCINLIDISVDDKNAYYSSVDGVLFNKNKTNLINYPIGKAEKEYSIPDGVTNIGDIAFYNSTNLLSLIVPDSVTSIGGYAFMGCTSLTNVYITDLAAWCNIEFLHDELFGSPSTYANPLLYAKNLYLNGELVTELVIPEGVSIIKENAFDGCTSITSVTIPVTVTDIGHWAFNGCINLNDIYITDIVNWCSFGFDTMDDEWDEYPEYYSNPLYYAKNLYINGELVTDLVIPDGVTNIAYGTFSNYDNLTSVTIPDSVTNIEYDAFYGCSNLETINLGSGATNIGYSAFEGCNKLSSVYYNGSEKDWSNITIGYYNDALTEAKIYYDSAIHSFGEPIVTLAPTCTDEGTLSKTCLTCGKVVTETIEAIGHNFVNGTCTLCTIENTFEYSNENGAVTITGYTGTDADVVIPSTIEGLPVRSIGRNAFYKCTDMTSVTIPDTVENICDYAFYWCTGLTSLEIPDGVKSIGVLSFYHCINLISVTIPSSVTKIDEDAFSFCGSLISVNITDIASWCGIDFSNYYSNPLSNSLDVNLYINGELATDIIIPENVASIGNYAFCSCESLTSVDITNGVTSIGSYAFSDCTNLETITIPNSVTSIGEYAFQNCTSLVSITIPNSVTSIGEYAFAGCHSLTSITIPDGITSIESDTFSWCENLTSIKIPDSVTSIGEHAFNWCENLTSIKIPDSVTSIGEHAFSNCSNLASVYITDITSWCNIDFGGYSSNPLYYADNLYINGELATDIDIPVSVTVIKDYAFYGYTSLTSITIHDGVTSIGNYAFQYCANLTTFTIPDGITVISDYVFSDCTNLKSITIGDSVTSIGDSAFANCSNLPSITIPNSITSINSYAFAGCDSLTSVIIPDSVKSIGSGVFYSCNALTSVIIPDSVTSIGNYIFYWCDSLKSITIPDSITSIGSSFFEYCKSLETIVIPGSIKSIGNDAFRYCDKLKYIFYDGSESDWSNISIGSNNSALSKATIHYNSTDHTYDVTVKNPATCTQSGLMHRVCTVCNLSLDNEEIPALGHNYSNEWTIDKAATCTEDGSKSHHCSVCEEKVDVTVIEATGHSYGDWVTDQEATCTVAGSNHQTCSVCNNTVTETIEALGHKYSEEWTIDKAATCTEDGSKSHHCSRCDSTTDVTVIEATGHNYVDGYCTYCDTCNAFEYTIENGAITITGYTGKRADLIIPSEIDGVPVVAIGERAFNSCDFLKSVTISDGITTIGDGAFAWCYSLTSVNLSASVKIIGAYAFQNCYILSSFSVDENNPYYSTIDGILFNKNHTELVAYTSGKTNEEYTVPGTVTRIGDYAFASTFYLSELTIPENVETIGSYAFIDSSISSIILNEGLKTIDDWAFCQVTKLTDILIPDSVTSIGEGAFSYCHGLTTISIPGNVTSLPAQAFRYSSGLREITLTNSIASIGDYAFDGCDNLHSIFYTGSSSEWYSLLNGENEYGLWNVAIHFNSVGHTMVDDMCEICGYKTWSYEAYDDHVVVTGYNGVKSDVVIPDTIAGLPVTEIGQSAFEGCSQLKNIAIPESVSIIGTGAFRQCSSLQSLQVTNGNSHFSSENGVLFNKDKTILICYPSGIQAQKYIIPETVTTICADAFYNFYLRTLIIPGNVKNIGAGAINRCVYLEKIVIENGVEDIDNYAFSDCMSLTSIDIPESVETIGVAPFVGCINLTSINVDENNSNYTDDDGVLFDKDKTVLIQYPEGKTDGEYIIPNSVVKIGDWAFDYCESLTSITIPNSVTTIGNYTFSNCDNLKYVFYPGSENDWAEITIGSNNTKLTQAIIHYNSTDHTYKTEVVTEATCTQSGLMHRVCTVCNLSLDNEEIPALGHNYSNEWTIDKAATCTEDGSKSHHCSRCDSITDLTVIEATGHLYGDWLVTLKPTCIKNGSQKKTCSLCGDVVTVAIDALGHNYSTEWTIDKAATCTEDGSKSHHCSRCSSKSEVTVIPATNHNYSEWATETEPTCTKNGVKARVCSNCSNKETNEIPALGHNYSTEWTIDKSVTCTTDGSKSRHCLRCDDKTDITVITATGHVYGDWTTDCEPTCTVAGSKHQTCSVCRNVSTESINALGHDYSSEWTIDKAATCLTDGSKSRHCSRCNSKADVTVITATGHIYGNWIVDKEASVLSEGAKHRICSVCKHNESQVIEKIQIDIESNTDYGLAVFTVVHAQTLEPINGAQIFISTENDGENTFTTDSNGQVSVVLPVGKQVISAYASGCLTRNLRVNIKPGVNNVPQIGLSELSTYDAKLTSKLMTIEEIEAAGIDTSDPDNQHVYRYELKLEFVPEIDWYSFFYYINGSGIIIGGGFGGGSGGGSGGSSGGSGGGYWISGNGDSNGSGGHFYIPATENRESMTIYPVSEYFYLIIRGEVRWLKEMFDVEMLVINNSLTDTLEDLTATLELPEGLSLAKMVSEQQNLIQEIDHIAEGESESVHWYVRGDKEGSYDLKARLQGMVMPFEEEIDDLFISENQLQVLAGKALKLHFEFPDAAYYGEDYPITITLTNVSDRTLYNISHMLQVVQGMEVYYSDGSSKTKVDTSALVSSGVIREFHPGDKIIIETSVNIFFKSEMMERQIQKYIGLVDGVEQLLNGIKAVNTALDATKLLSSCITGCSKAIDNFIASSVETSTKTELFEQLHDKLSSLYSSYSTSGNKTVDAATKLANSSVSITLNAITNDPDLWLKNHSAEDIKGLLDDISALENSIISPQNTSKKFDIFDSIRTAISAIPVRFALKNVIMTEDKNNTTSIPWSYSVSKAGPQYFGVSNVSKYMMSLIQAMGAEIYEETMPGLLQLIPGLDDPFNKEEAVKYIQATENEIALFKAKDATGKVGFKVWVERNEASTYSLRNTSVSGDFLLECNNDTATYENGILTFTGEGMISVTPQSQTGGTLYIEDSEGNLYTYVIDVVEEHTCECGDREVVISPTADFDGFAVKSCTTCGEIMEIEPLAYSDCCEVHSFADWVEDEKEFCTASGLRSRCCSTCGFTETEIVDGSAHTFVDGVCSVCGIGNSDESLFDYEISDNSVTITDCEITEGEVVIPNKINGLPVTEIGSTTFEDSNDVTSIVIPETVTSVGDSAFENCDSLEYIFYPGSESDWEKVSIGENNKPLTDAIIHFNSTDHSYEEKIDAEATCTEDGAKHQECSVCGYSLGSESISALGHDYSTEWTIDKAVTCTENGSKSRHCSRCDSTTDVTVIAATGHIYGGWVIDKEVTCSQDGEKQRVCSACNNTEIIKTPATGHYFKDGYCKKCNEKQLFKYSINDNSVTIISYLGEDTDVVIPATIDGYQVTSIRDYAFQDCTTLISIKIPNSVTSIGKYAFSGCTSLASITLPDSVETIGEHAFSDCTNLTSITIPDSVTSIGDSAFANCSNLPSITIPNSITSINSYVFAGCDSLTSVIIPDSVKSIGSGVFYSCSALTSVIIPDSVTSISEGTFSECSNLSSITIPYSVTYIGDDAFSDCAALISINVDENNTNYSSFDGVLFDKDKTTLIRYPSGKANTEYIIYDSVTNIYDHAFSNCDNLTSIKTGNGVTSIGDSAFYNCDNLTSIRISDRVTTIGDSAFSWCTKLKSITIPDSVTSIGDRAFYYCESLTSITLSKNLKNIGYDIFYYCISLTSVEIPDSVTSIDDYAFQLCTSLTSITIPDSVTSIGEDAFSACTSLTSVILPNSVTTICDGAFSNCSNLNSITLSNNITSIGEDTFYSCTSLSSIEIPDGVITIGRDAFWDCTGLVSVTISDSVTSIDTWAFYGCDELKYVFYSGSENDWSNISIGSRNTSLTNAAIHYNATDHTYGEWIIDVEPTCTENGEKHHVCSVCDYTEPVEVVSTGHYFTDGYCTVCGVKYVFDYSIENNSVSITGYTGTESDVEIPALIEGFPVTSIARRAFYNCIKINSITIPDGVTKIGDEAFYNCTNLATITIPENVTTIGAAALKNCKNLERVYWNAKVVADFTSSSTILYSAGTSGKGIEFIFGNTVETIPAYLFYVGSSQQQYRPKITSVIIGENASNIRRYAFSGCTSLKSVTIPDSVTSIGDCAFSYCTGLTSVTIGKSVTNIGGSVFFNCTSLESITIPESVTSIGDCAFVDCKNLTSINVNENNTKYLSDNGILFTNDKTEIICYPAGKIDTEYTIPESVTTIGDNVFQNCINLVSIKIPEGVTSIGANAFSYCTGLKSITIPDSVTSMGVYVFERCDRLSSVKIGNNVTDISDAAFYQCSSLYSLTIPDSVTSIGYEAFYQCDRLYSVRMGNGVTSIDSYAFYMCDNLDSIIISNNLTSIGSDAFCDCQNLTEVYYRGLLSEWDNITIDSGNECLTNANISHLCTYGDWVVNTEPTCTEDGSRSKTCIVCGEGETETITATGHNYSTEWTVDVEVTCTTDGSKSHHCTACGDKADVTIIPTTGHNYGDWVVTLEPTCSEEGSHSKTCSVCDGVVTEVIAANGHNYSTEWTIDQAATCTDAGSKSHHCTVCGDKTDTTVIEAIGHNYVVQNTEATHPHTTTYICTFCQNTKTKTAYISDCVECNFQVAAIDSSSYKLVSYIGTETDIVIPSNYKGYAITTIANACFRNNKTIKSVKIPDSVTSIGSLAFMSCTSLEKVYIPASVTSIGSQAFYGFTGTIYCTNGSTAHNYAVTNNIPFVLVSITGIGDTKIDYENMVIRTSVQNCSDITKVLWVSDSVEVVSLASYTYGSLELFGTGTVFVVFDGNDYIGDFTLIVEGDTNGDSVCDALDAAQVALASNGHENLDGAYTLAADSNYDDMVDINDYQQIVNKAVS